MPVFIFLSLFSFFVHASEYEISLYVVKSPLGLSWNSPMSALFSIQKNRLILTKRPLGSVFTEVKCGDQNALRTTSFETMDIFNQLVLNQEGLGVFFHSFPGRLEKGDSLRDELAGFFTEGRVNFITFSLNKGQCNRALDYLRIYEEKNIGQNWGLTNVPRRGEGGNSAAFAVSLLEILGFKEEIFKEGWVRARRVPRDLVGPPREDKKVNFFKILGTDWAKKQEPYHLLSFWDPELIHEWISRNLENFPKIEKFGIQGIHLERNHFPLLKTPYWLHQENLEP